MKQTHDIKLAESLSLITKKLEEAKEYTQKLGKIFTVNNTPQLAVENTQSESPLENDRIHPGVIYDSSLENTLSNVQKQK